MTLVANLTWDVVARRLEAGALAILPIGAGAKQHGWHLPMGTDQIQAEWCAARLAEAYDALVWPTLTFGHYPAFVDYAGSTSLSAPLFEALVREILDALFAYGPRGVVVVDSGISTIAPTDRAIAASRKPDRILHLKIYAGERIVAVRERLAVQAHGGHADEIETALMLALAPDRVALSRAAASPATPPGPGPMQHADPQGANFSASGSIGDPTRATSIKGETLRAAMQVDLIDAVRSWLARL